MHGSDSIMAGALTHLAIADRIYLELGNDVIKNLPLFFGGNIAPDAIHAKTNYQRSDKIRSHLCEGIELYGYGHPKINQLFHNRINKFIEKYYLTAGADRDLYLGYIIHLLVDELDVFSVCDYIAGLMPIKAKFYRNIADEVKTGVYREFFTVSSQEYEFNQNIVDVLEAVWDYEVKDYISINEINTSKRWVIDNIYKSEPLSKSSINTNCERVFKFIEYATNNIIHRISCIL